jgi:hypothetical protein
VCVWGGASDSPCIRLAPLEPLAARPPASPPSLLPPPPPAAGGPRVLSDGAYADLAVEGFGE